MGSLRTCGYFLYLLGPFFLFGSYYNGAEFSSFSGLTSLIGLITIFSLAASDITLKKLDLSITDFILFTIIALFSLTAFNSEDTILSFKRSILVVYCGSLFYLLGRLSRRPDEYCNKAVYLNSIGITLLFAHTVVVYLWGEPILSYGQAALDLGLASDTFKPFSVITLFDSIYVGQSYGGRFVGEYFFFRPSSIFSNPNGLALYSMVVFGLACYSWDFRSKLGWLITIIILVLLLWTASRAAVLGSLVFFISYIFCRTSFLNRYIPTIIFIVFAIPFTFYFYSILTAPSSIWYNHIEILELRERGDGWRFAIESFQLKNIVSGIGFGLAQEEFLGPNNFVFSIWIILLIETGILGLSLIILIWLITLTKLYKSLQELPKSTNLHKTNAVLFSLLLAIAFHQSFDLSIFRFHPLNFLFFSLLGLAANPRLKPDFKIK